MQNTGGQKAFRRFDLIEPWKKIRLCLGDWNILEV